MNISLRKPVAALAGCIAIALSACGGSISISSSGSSGGGGAIDPPLTAPTISAPAENQSVVKGETATFKVVATGSALTYQWKKNGSDISGATSSSYTTPETTIADNNTVFSVSVSNSAGSVNSAATLTVLDKAVAATITTQPADQTAITGQTVTFSVTATGTSLQYQWKKGGADIPGATSSSYTTTATSMADSGAAYSVSVSNSVSTVTSNNATLTVTAAVVVPVVVAPAIDTQPAVQTVTEGESATFSVTATGTAPFTYQWKKNGIDIEGVTTSSHTTDATVLGDSGAVFTVVVTNSAGSVTSSDAALTVNAAPPTISTQPANQTITADQTATFSVTATGTGTLSYQWKKNGTDISGANSNTYTTPAMNTGGSGVGYSVVVSNSAGTTTSSSATLTVNKSSATGYSYVPNPSGGNYDKTECVKENSTGLVWEGKTASPATSRLGTDTYTNYDGTGVGQKSDGSNATQAEIDANTNSIGYKNSVNTSALCGYTDWRLPTVTELQGILASSGSPRIDTTWFPNTQANAYWSSSPYVGASYYAWNVHFYDGGVYNGDRSGLSHVRLVR